MEGRRIGKMKGMREGKRKEQSNKESKSKRRNYTWNSGGMNKLDY